MPVNIDQSDVDDLLPPAHVTLDEPPAEYAEWFRFV